MVDASHHGGGVQAAHHETAQTQGQSEQGLNTADDAVFNGDKDGTDDGVSQIAGAMYASLAGLGASGTGVTGLFGLLLCLNDPIN